MRLERMQKLICQEVNSLLRKKSTTDGRFLFATVTFVRLSKDFANATLYWDTFNASKRGDLKKDLESIKGQIRNYLSKQIHNRKIPALRFEYDSRFESEKKIQDILKTESLAGKVSGSCGETYR